MAPGRVAAFIGLGSNVGDPRQQVRTALAVLDELRETRVTAVSSLYRTAPVGYVDQPDFINAVAQIETSLTARELLTALLDIERAHNRVREVKNGPRTLDLDLLLYDERTIREPDLKVPHPRMHQRAFVLAPLAEIAPDARLGDLGTAAQLLARVAGEGVEKLGTD
jgi:2-amino-4-hydroxy-6-hydroxymethyldihydropteridine diphosphokinase